MQNHSPLTNHPSPTKGQGAQTNPHNRFHKQSYKVSEDYLDYLVAEGENQKRRTKVIEIHPKTIVNEVKSPDVPMPWSLNPYQGCEHGCTYCYAPQQPRVLGI